MASVHPVKSQITQTCRLLVKTYGWSDKVLLQACEAHNLSPVKAM